MWTSTTLVSGWISIPQTSSRIIDRVTTRPAFRHRYSRRTNSCGVKLRISPFRDASRLSRSSSRSSTRKRVAPVLEKLLAPEQVTQPGQQLGECERLGQVIVAALLKPS